jgi:hypothetical protein
VLSGKRRLRFLQRSVDHLAVLRAILLDVVFVALGHGESSRSIPIVEQEQRPPCVAA